MQHPPSSRALLLLSILLAACGGSPATPDAGAPPDTGRDDVDAAVPADAPPDAFVPWTPPTDCDATDVDVHTPPPGIPAFTSADRGRVIACGQGDPIAAATIDARARERGYDGPAITAGVTRTEVLYQSERRSGEAGFSTGVLYLPEGGATDAPLIVYAAGTTGIGDPCAPSDLERRYEDFERAFYVLIGSGRPVFVPDLIGLGTPGTMAWLESVDAGHSVLDGARAALAIAPDGALSGEMVLAGHSAGGHAVIAAQSYQPTYAPELDVLGVSGVAAAYLDTSAFGLLLYYPDYDVTHPNDGWNAIYGAFYFVGHSASYDGEEHAWDPIAPANRDALRTIFESACLENPGAPDLREQVAAVAPRLDGLIEETLRTSVSNCYLGISCDALGTTWTDRFDQDRPAVDPAGAPVWFHHGDADARVTLASMACPIRDAMTADPRTTACIYAGIDHNHAPEVVAPWLVTWADALAAGDPAPACPETTPLPACP